MTPSPARERRIRHGIHLAGLAAMTLARAPHVRTRLGSMNASSPVDAFVVGATSASVGLLPALDAATPLLRRFDIASPPVLRGPATVLGTALWAASARVFARSHADLGRNWSPTLEIAPGQEVVTGGIYARVRHPMYAGYLLGSFGQALLLRNHVSGSVAPAAAALLCAVRIPREEAMMRAAFGPDYAAYAARTPALLPRWPRRSAPGPG